VTIVRTGSRLHFGLFDVRHFGGVGLMIDEPVVVASAHIADRWSIKGLLPHRARFVIDRLCLYVPDLPPMRVEVSAAPPEHAGFGVGTQVSLAMATAIAAEAQREIATTTLARILERGQRSAIGIHGFEHGGFLIDAGKSNGDTLAPLAHRLELPPAWRVLLITPIVTLDWSGDRERDAFARLSSQPHVDSHDELSQFAEAHLASAARTGDLVAFGAALTEFNARAGELFAPVQGGRYASPAIAELIERLRACGLTGVGQSSWGPTVFAFGNDEDVLKQVGREFSCAGAVVRIVRPRHRGADIERAN
jgi:beta-ribofuranosylaminobenzene 5'-phosphate synthase